MGVLDNAQWVWVKVGNGLQGKKTLVLSFVSRYRQKLLQAPRQRKETDCLYYYSDQSISPKLLTPLR